MSKTNKKGVLPPYHPTGVGSRGPSPMLVCAHTFPLPESDKELLEYYNYIRNYLDRLWECYVIYCKMVNPPEAGKIFKIIFTEMDYFEVINGRIIEKMSETFRLQVNHDYIL